MSQNHIPFSQNPPESVLRKDCAEIHDSQIFISKQFEKDNLEIAQQVPKEYNFKYSDSVSLRQDSKPQTSRKRGRTDIQMSRIGKKTKTVKVISKTLKIKQFAQRLINQSSIGKFKSITFNQLQLIGDNAYYGGGMISSSENSYPQDDKGFMKQIQRSDFCKWISQFNNLSRQVLSGQLIQIDCLSKLPVISPTSSLRFLWDIIMVMAIIALLFVIPIEVTFRKHIHYFFPSILQSLITMVLILEFVIQLNCGYFDKGLPIMNRREIAAKYLKADFIIDIISSSFIITDYFRGFEEYNIFHLLFFLKIRNIKLFFKRIEERFNMNPLVMQISSLVQLLWLILFASHIISCVWIKVDFYELEQEIESWISFKNIQREDWTSIYIHAYYFSTVTMITVGYGDFKPINSLEMIISVITMLTSCGIFAYTINMIGTIFNSINDKNSEIKNNLFYVGKFMNKKKIGSELQIQIKEYLEYQWKNHPNEDLEKEAQLLSQLTPQLRERLMYETYKDILQNYSVFKKNFSQQFLLSMISVIEEVVFCPDELIYSQLFQCDPALYFVVKGKLIAFVKEEEGTDQIKTFKQGDTFGELSFFSNQSDELNVKAIEHSLVYKIRRNQFLEVLRKFPEDNQTFCHIQDSLLYQSNHHQAGAMCPICIGEHFPLQCSFVFPTFNKVINASNKSEPQFRQQIEEKQRSHKGFSWIHHTFFQNKLEQFIKKEKILLNKYRDVYLYVNQSEYESENQYSDETDICNNTNENEEDEEKKEQEEEEKKYQQNAKRNSCNYSRLQSPLRKSFLLGNHSNLSQMALTKQIEATSEIPEQDSPINTPKAIQPRKTNLLTTFASNTNPFQSISNYLDYQINTTSNRFNSFSQIQSPTGQQKNSDFKQTNSTSDYQKLTNSLSENQKMSKRRMSPALRFRTSLNQSNSEIPIPSSQNILHSELSQNQRKSNQINIKGKPLSSYAQAFKQSRLYSILNPKSDHQIEDTTINIECIATDNDKESFSLTNYYEVEIGFDIQCNFFSYLPHNNLSTIIEYFKAKQSKLRSTGRKQGYQQTLALTGEYNNLNYQLIRDFQRKQNSRLTKSNNESNLKVVQLKQRSNYCAKTHLQLLIYKFQKLSERLVTNSEIRSNQNKSLAHPNSTIETCLLGKRQVIEASEEGLQSLFYQKYSKCASIKSQDLSCSINRHVLPQMLKSNQEESKSNRIESSKLENAKIQEETSFERLNKESNHSFKDDANVYEREDNNLSSNQGINSPNCSQSYETGSFQMRNTLLYELDINKMKKGAPQNESYFE